MAQGSQFQVNTYTTGNQKDASVAMDSAGDFVVAWQSNGNDGSEYGVYAQRYNASGAAQGTELPGQYLHLGQPATAIGGHGFGRRFRHCLGERRR